MSFNPEKIKALTAENVQSGLMFLFVWFPLRIVSVKLAWWIFGTDVHLTWGVATFIAIVCPFVRPNLVLHYNSMQMPLAAFSQRRPRSAPRGAPN